jgi:hypothetical protein
MLCGKPRPLPPAPLAHCLGCGQPIVNGWPRQRFCTLHCGKRYRMREYRLRKKEVVSSVPATMPTPLASTEAPGS